MSRKVDVPPAEPLLDRDQVPGQIAENLAEPVSYPEVLADYGVGLLKRSFFSSAREIPDVVLLPVLFRQVLAFLDAVHLHLSNGAVYAAAPDVRAMFEAALALEWISAGPSELKEPRSVWRDRWARQYYVSELRQERDWARSLIPRTRDHAKLKNVAPDLAKKLASDPEKLSAAKERVAEIGRHIGRRPRLRAINSKFGPLKKKLRGREPAWYRVGGPSSISQLAQRLGRSDELGPTSTLMTRPATLSSFGRMVCLPSASPIALTGKWTSRAPSRGKTRMSLFLNKPRSCELGVEWARQPFLERLVDNNAVPAFARSGVHGSLCARHVGDPRTLAEKRTALARS